MQKISYSQLRIFTTTGEEGGLQCPDKAPDLCSLLCSQPACLDRHYPANPIRRELIRPGIARHKASLDLEAAQLSLHKAVPLLVSPPRTGRYALHGASSGVCGPLLTVYPQATLMGALMGKGQLHTQKPSVF